VEGSLPSEPRTELKPESVTAARIYIGREDGSAIEKPEKPKETGGVLQANSSDVGTESVGDKAKDVSGQQEEHVATPKEAKKPATSREKPKPEPKLVQKQVAGLGSKVVGDKAQDKEKGKKPATTVTPAKKAARPRGKQKPKPAAVKAEILGLETGIVDDKTLGKDDKGDGPTKEKGPAARVTAAKKPARSGAKLGPKPTALKAEVSGAETEIVGDKDRDNDAEGDGPEEKKTPAATGTTEKKPVVRNEITGLGYELAGDKAQDKDNGNEPAATITSAKKVARSMPKSKPKPAAVEEEAISFYTAIASHKDRDSDADDDERKEENSPPARVTAAKKPSRSRAKSKPKPAAVEANVADLQTGIAGDKVQDKDSEGIGASEENRGVATVTTARKPARSRGKPKPMSAVVQAEVADSAAVTADQIGENKPAATVTAARKPARLRAKPKLKQAVAEAEIVDFAIGIAGDKTGNSDAEGAASAEKRPAAAVTTGKKTTRARAKPNPMTAVQSVANRAQPGETTAAGPAANSPARELASGLVMPVSSRESQVTAGLNAVVHPSTTLGSPGSKKQGAVPGEELQYIQSQNRRTFPSEIPATPPYEDDELSQDTPPGTPVRDQGSPPSTPAVRSSTLSPTSAPVAEPSNHADAEPADPATRTEPQGSPPSIQTVPSTTLITTTTAVAEPPNLSARMAFKDPPIFTQDTPWTTPSSTQAPVAESPNRPARMVSQDSPPSTQAGPSTTTSAMSAPVAEPSSLPENLISLNRRLDNISAAAALFEEASRQLDFENVSQEDQDLMIEFVISDAMRDPQFARLFRAIVRVTSDPDVWQGM